MELIIKGAPYAKVFSHHFSYDFDVHGISLCRQ